MTSSTSFSGVSASEISFVSTSYRQASQIPLYCTEIAAILEKAPLFAGKGASFEKSKVIALETWEDARICAIFNRNTFPILGKEAAWHIRSFGGSTNTLTDSRGNLIRTGVTLWLFNESKRCSLEALQTSYQQIFTSMVTGWIPSRIEDNPDIMFPENDKEFLLFTKPERLEEECTLIACIAIKLGMESAVKCHNEWFEYPGYKQGTAYLWINKTDLPAVVDTFGFQFP